MKGSPPQSVFVGVSGASGAPYAARLVRRSPPPAAAPAEHLESGVLVLEHELELAVAGARRSRRRSERTGATADVFAPRSGAPLGGSAAP
jgi:3-polyprenyl-4-hydroxybenzoate decarboxylase